MQLDDNNKARKALENDDVQAFRDSLENIVESDGWGVEYQADRWDGNINIRDGWGNSWLHLAVEYEAPKIAIFLIENSPQLLNQRNRKGITPLLLSLMNEQKNMPGLLINAGSDLNATHKKGVTILQYAAKFGRQDVIEKMIKKSNKKNPLHVNAQDWNGNTVFHHLGERNQFSKKSPNIIRILQSIGGDLEKRNWNGWAAIHVAVDEQNKYTVKGLLEAGANVNALTPSCETALHKLYFHSFCDIPKILAEYKIDPTIKNRSGMMALERIERYHDNKKNVLKFVKNYTENFTLDVNELIGPC